jgi:hypothetical protein
MPLFTRFKEVDNEDKLDADNALQSDITLSEMIQPVLHTVVLPLKFMKFPENE